MKTMTLEAKFALMAAASVLITASALVFLALWQSDRYNTLAQNEVEALIDADLDHITQGVLNLVRTENEAVRHSIDTHLNVARHLLTAAGGISPSEEIVPWTAVNELTKNPTSLNLPKLLIGETWLGQNTDLSQETPVVDQLFRLVGVAATIFQRVNEAGDMLRVATTMKDPAGERAIGSYIPAVPPDGARNPVLAAILDGKTFHGRNQVSGRWYLAAYAPLKNSAGEILGMLCVGIEQKTVESRVRSAILNTGVGKTGYVYVLGGSGIDRGRYIISQNGARDGEDIWESQDSDGNYVIQEIVRMAGGLNPDEMATIRYRWQNPGDSEPRWKTARLAYYEPWDWIIGTSVYEDELQTYRSVLTDGRLRMMRGMTIAGLLIAFLLVLISILLTLKISRPIRQITRVAEKISSGDFNQEVEVHSDDDIGILADTFNLMTHQLRHSMDSLRKSEEKYRLIFENALEGLFQSSIEGRVINTNPAMARILGYDSPEQLIDHIADAGQQLYVNSEDRDRFLSSLTRQGEVMGFEVQLLRRDNVKTWVSISARLAAIETGAPPLIEGFISNIDDRKQAEEALAESKNYLNEIFNTVGDPMVVKNQQHQWVLVNDAMCAFAGHTREEILGKTDHDFFRKDEAEIFLSKDKAVLATGEENINEELFTDASGTVHTLLTKKTLYTDKNREKYIVAVIRDITSQKTAEEEKRQLELRLGQAQKMEAIGTMAGGIAHDFNNILSAIIGYTELTQDDAQNPDRVRKNLDQVLKSSDRAKELVRQILTFSRMTETEYSPIALRSVVKESLKMLRSMIPSTIDIRQRLTASGLVMSDPTQLHQIVMNLCTNAAHAMDETGGVLEVTLSEAAFEAPTVLNDFPLSPGPYLNLTIRDTGKGISEEIISHIFEPYFTTKAQGRGTGLGLSVIHGIVNSHKGAVTCHSIPGEGTTFSVYLPMIKSAKAQTPATEKAPLPGGRERILYVDDEAILVNMDARMLTSRGYQVVSMTESLEALELFRKSPGDFDMVITDMTMPVMTGDRLALEMIAIRNDIPIILCTGYSDHISETTTDELGIKALLFKPLDMRTLTETIRRVLDHT